ncbi:MAG: PaaI family thioesterase [Verrucomicrobiales bacterium]|nr:PaaI family thioesterase [Verrucomicrobiales bacterium]
MQTLPHTRSCFVCGEANPAGLKLRFQTDGRVVEGRFVPQAAHVGFKGVVHGGIIATVLDEVMVWACAVATRQFAVCAELTVRFLKPVRPGEELVVTGELVVNRKGRIFEAKASARSAAGTTVAEATGKYLPIKPDELREFASDLIGDTSSLLGK